MMTKISNPTHVMVLVRQISSCSAALDRFDDDRPSQDDDNDLGDEDLPLLDDRKLGSSQIFDSFEISSPDMKVDSPRFFKKPVDESGDDSKSNKYHYPSEASIRMASLNESDIEESADDDNDDAKSDFFKNSTQANSKYFDGKFVRRGSDFHIQDDEDYSRPHPTLPMPTSRTYKWQNVDEGDVMPYNSLSSSSGPSAYHLPLEKEVSRGIVRGRLSLSPTNSLNRHAPESSTQPHETNLRNPVSLLEPGDAAGDRDDIMSDSTFGTGYDASISASSSNRGTDPLADKDIPLAHSQSAGGTHPGMTIAARHQIAASDRRSKNGGPGRFRCNLCPQTFDEKYNLESKSPTLQILVALSLMNVFQIILTLIRVSKPTHAMMVVEIGSLLRVLFIGIARCVKPKLCWNPPNTHINLKTIRSLKWKDPCRGQRHVVTTRSGGMFSASCRTTCLFQL